MGHVLLRLYEGDNCIIKDISQSMHIANGTMTGLLKRMQKSGLIACRRCSEDGRAVRVSLTRLGRSLEPRIRDFHRQVIAIVQEGMTSGEVETVKGLLGHMLNSLRVAEEAMRPDPRKPLKAAARGRRKPKPKK
jgi:DNA-binding MarR family transcriptional regulator